MPCNVLIVEDNAGYGEALEAAVGLNPDFTVVGRVNSGSAALQFLSQPRCQVNLILLDLRLPEGTGTEILPRLKSLMPSCSVLVLTQSSKEHDVVQALGRGADGYLLKSASLPQIAAALKVVMGGGNPIDPQVAGCLLAQVRASSSTAGELGVLTDREIEVLHLLAQGRTKKEIAADLHVSYATVDSHARNIYTKLQAGNIAEAITKGYKAGLIRLE